MVGLSSPTLLDAIRLTSSAEMSTPTESELSMLALRAGDRDGGLLPRERGGETTGLSNSGDRAGVLVPIAEAARDGTGDVWGETLGELNRPSAAPALRLRQPSTVPWGNSPFTSNCFACVAHRVLRGPFPARFEHCCGSVVLLCIRPLRL